MKACRKIKKRIKTLLVLKMAVPKMAEIYRATFLLLKNQILLETLEET